MKHFILLLLLPLAACAQQGQNNYNWQDVGQATELQFGTVVSERPVSITGRNTGTGALVGMAAGAGAGSYVGNGSGSAWAAGAGLLIGALAGAAAEQAAADHQGIEYVVTLESGKTLSIVQNTVEGDTPIRTGSRVVVQTSGSYQRVLPAEGLPTRIKRPKKISVVG